MPGHTVVNLERDVEDLAPKFGMAPPLEVHFATRHLGLEASAVGLERIDPGARAPFGHRHERQEELYVVIGGSGRVKLDDEVVEIGGLDAIRVAPQTMRCFEAGPDGLEILAFGAPNLGEAAGEDAEIVPGWWSD